MIPFREAIPHRVMKATREATEATPPVRAMATTAPIKAKGMLSRTWITIRTDLKCA
jgi:hypothetical protein